MRTSQTTNEIMKAIKLVQQGADPVQKTAKGQVGSRAYQYGNLNDTWDTIKDLMNQNNLVVIQSPTTGETNIGHFFQTTLQHTESGEWIQEQMVMVLQRDDPQAIGAAITYYRRYMLTSMLGLIPDDDNDARDHRLATAQQKARIVGAVKELNPDLAGDHRAIIEAVTNIAGKAPQKIREDEADDVIAMIKAFQSKE